MVKKKTLRYLPNYKKHFKKCGYSKAKISTEYKKPRFFLKIYLLTVCAIKKNHAF